MLLMKTLLFSHMIIVNSNWWALCSVYALFVPFFACAERCTSRRSTSSCSIGKGWLVVLVMKKLKINFRIWNLGKKVSTWILNIDIPTQIPKKYFYLLKQKITIIPWTLHSAREERKIYIIWCYNFHTK